MTMAHLSAELEKTGSPVDAAYAQAIAAMLLARGTDIPLPAGDAQSAPLNDAQESGQLTQSSSTALELFSGGGNIYDSMRDGLMARFQATHELEMFPAPEVSVQEEVFAEQARERREAETSAHDFLVTIMDKLVPADTIYPCKEYPIHNGVMVPDVQSLRRMQSTTFFAFKGMPASGEHSPRRLDQYYTEKGAFKSYTINPHVVIGARDVVYDEWFATEVLSFNLATRRLRMYAVNAEDYQAFMRLPQSYTAPTELTEDGVRDMMQNDGRLYMTAFSPGSIAMSYECASAQKGWLYKSAVNGEMSMQSNIRTNGLRLFAVYRPGQVVDEFAKGRLAESVIEAYEIPRHLADLSSALTNDQATSALR